MVEPLKPGGNAETWLAEGPTGRVVVKILRNRNQESEPFRRFAQEARIQLADLSGIAGLLPVYEAHIPARGSAAYAWLVTPLASPFLDALGEAPTVDDVLLAFRGIANSLGELAARGYSHRDVKPDNLYRLDGEWVVGDLGLLQVPSSDGLTVGALSFGPRHFLAPEMVFRADGADGALADIYSLGKSIWCVFMGYPYPLPGPHDSSYDPVAIASTVNDPRAPLVDRLVESMTRFNPLERLAMADVVRELDALCRATVYGEAVTDEERLEALRMQFEIAAAASGSIDQNREAVRRAVDSLDRKLERLVRPAIEVLERAGVPLQSVLTESLHPLKGSRWSITRPAQGQDRSKAVVASLQYETGFVGRNSAATVNMWAGYSIQADVYGQAFVTWAYVLGPPPHAIWQEEVQFRMATATEDAEVERVSAEFNAYASEAAARYLEWYRQIRN